MSGLKTLSRLAFLVKSNNCTSQSMGNIRGFFPKTFYTPQILRPTATRSIWSLCHTKASEPRVDTKFARFTKTCGCCGLHTSGDQELSDFLTNEIKLEKKNQASSAQLPKIQGFEVTQLDGADVLLSKRYENEQVVVKFNVNHTVDDDAEDDFESTQSSEPSEVQMTSKPPFVVEITKGENRTLALQCSFPPADAMPESQQEEGYVDLIEIQEVALLDKSQEWDDKIYAVSGSVMDGNLYDMLLNMLEERGIDGGFVDQLIEYSTAYEQKKYVGFLEQLQDFVSCAK